MNGILSIIKLASPKAIEVVRR